MALGGIDMAFTAGHLSHGLFGKEHVSVWHAKLAQTELAGS